MEHCHCWRTGAYRGNTSTIYSALLAAAPDIATDAMRRRKGRRCKLELTQGSLTMFALYLRKMSESTCG